MEDRTNYTAINALTWDHWAKTGIDWSIPVTHDEFAKAQQGEWGVYLTPTRFVPKEWFPPFAGTRILGLASGGGQQMPIFAALGADCTVFDYSDQQLALEREVAEREGYTIRIVKGDMTKPLPFADDEFDVIFHPVSNCYVEDVYHVWNECYRILKPGGVLLAGMDNGLNFLVNDDGKLPLTIANKLPYNPLRNASEEEYQSLIDNYHGIQFSHTLEEQIGGQLKAGFILTDLYEDRDREGLLREYAPQYFATRAIKPCS
ncbi:MAG: class I SAM-dependent methyltransferase [Firmicutes bacterium]|jgi:SAM-dependent methyltransferase|nr:class I SAM-dependent methyltransferase [Bacillota bacterium]